MFKASVVCDVCGSSLNYTHTGKTHVKRWAREEGWSFGKKDLCPKCKRKKKEN